MKLTISIISCCFPLLIFAQFNGGSGDGYSSSSKSAQISISAGGYDDGYADAFFYTDFIWTGTVGTGWNVPSNWNNNVIPTIRSKVIIPSDVPNFPFVNAGLLSIGEIKNPSTYFCRGVEIASGAEMTLRINATLENYSNLTIDGSLFILYSSNAAVKNLENGVIKIQEGGQMRFE